MNNNIPLPQQVARMDAERLRGYRENLAFYGGAQWTGAPHRRERRLTFNYARTFIDKITSYLMTEMSLVVGPTDSSAEALDRARRAGGGFTPSTRGQPPGPAGLRYGAGRRHTGGRLLQGGLGFPGETGEDQLARCPGSLRLVGGGRREPYMASGQPLLSLTRTGQDALRRQAARAGEQEEPGNRCGGMDPQGVPAVGGRYTGTGEGQPLRLHPLCHIPQPTGTQEVLGPIGHSAHR